MANIGNCMNCVYFAVTKKREEERGGGLCHRYPTPAEHAPNYWCGEFERKQSHTPSNYAENWYG